ncbi:MAG: hypothetical protein EXS05_03255 [Planctomycetaceae bacterium]|nr:hypothetical protein [Planctomycetaceae bacterium]
MNAVDELQRLTVLFPGSSDLIEGAEHIPSSLTPEPYKTLLLHEQHMTVTMERFHNTALAVRVIDRRLEGDVYSRKILLESGSNGRVVQFGIVRFDLSYVTAAVRREILNEDTPLGRILINHNVLRHIDLGAIVRIRPGQQLCTLFNCSPSQETYGRLATIFCNQKPAVDLLEIAAPIAWKSPT